MARGIRLAAVSAVVLGASLLASPALAQTGPSHAQPAEKPLTRSQAHRSAAIGQEVFLAAILPHAAVHIGRCEGGPLLWRCPMKLKAADTACTATVLVWKDAVGRIYAEDNRLRCTAR